MPKRRISKVTTRAGDSGTTKLATGRTVQKSAPYVRAVGAVDELNSFIGVAISQAAPQTEALKDVQQALFDMGAVFAMEGAFEAPGLEALEANIEAFNEQLPPLTEFVIPGGTESAAALHVCRTVCRRAEAELWSLIDEGASAESYVECARYLNRLSDLFFVLARTANAGTTEAQWRGPQEG